MIRQFDVVPNPNPEFWAEVPFVLILQAESVAASSTVAASLVPHSPRVPPQRMFPTFDVNGRQLTLITTDIASLPRTVLREPVANLVAERHRIIAALDILFTGF